MTTITGLDRKAMLGARVRRLRQDHGLTQAQMAERMGISPSYLNLIEHNQRPVTVPVLLRLAQTFDVDLQTFAGGDDARLADALTEVFADHLFDDSPVRRRDIHDLAGQSPDLAQAVLTLYGAWRRAAEDLATLAGRMAEGDGATPTAQPLETVREFFAAAGNHFPELETAAEALWEDAGLRRGDLWKGLCLHLEAAHGIRVRVLPAEAMGAAIRRYDHHGRQLLLSELLPAPKRAFQAACHIAYLQHGALLDRLLDAAGPTHPEARWAARLGLANYFAGAVLMPYEPVLAAARRPPPALRHRAAGAPLRGQFRAGLPPPHHPAAPGRQGGAVLPHPRRQGRQRIQALRRHRLPLRPLRRRLPALHRLRRLPGARRHQDPGERDARRRPVLLCRPHGAPDGRRLPRRPPAVRRGARLRPGARPRTGLRRRPRPRPRRRAHAHRRHLPAVRARRLRPARPPEPAPPPAPGR